jgi:hypothetical protein
MAFPLRLITVNDVATLKVKKLIEGLDDARKLDKKPYKILIFSTIKQALYMVGDKLIRALLGM